MYSSSCYLPFFFLLSPLLLLFFFFFNDTATTEIYTLSLHDALPISVPHPHLLGERRPRQHHSGQRSDGGWRGDLEPAEPEQPVRGVRGLLLPHRDARGPDQSGPVHRRQLRAVRRSP